MNRQKLYGKYLIREVILCISILVLFALMGDTVKAKECDLKEEMNSITWQSYVIDMVETIIEKAKKIHQIRLEESYIKLTDEDLAILYRITESEATGGTVEQKMNVCWCVLNRVNEQGKEFPNTIGEVVFQKMNGRYQFSPIADNRYYEVVITEDTKTAVANVLKNIGKHDGLWFMARSDSESDNITWFDTALNKLFEDKLHEYFGRKG